MRARKIFVSDVRREKERLKPSNVTKGSADRSCASKMRVVSAFGREKENGNAPFQSSSSKKKGGRLIWREKGKRGVRDGAVVRTAREKGLGADIVSYGRTVKEEKKGGPTCSDVAKGRKKGRLPSVRNRGGSPALRSRQEKEQGRCRSKSRACGGFSRRRGEGGGGLRRRKRRNDDLCAARAEESWRKDRAAAAFVRPAPKGNSRSAGQAGEQESTKEKGERSSSLRRPDAARPRGGDTSSFLARKDRVKGET